MKLKKISCIYFSPTGGTDKILRAVAAGLAESGASGPQYYNLTCSRQVPLPEFSCEELVIVALPVYGGRIPALMEDPLRRLKGNGALCVPIVVYGNRAWEDALLELSDLLTAQNFTAAGAGVFVAEHSYGRNIAANRPDQDDLASAKAFGRAILEKIQVPEDASKLKVLEIPGNHPYKERTPSPVVWAPETLENCDGCTYCAQVCPMQIIDPQEPSRIMAPELCLHCCACVKQCPHHAKAMTAAPYQQFHGFLTANCTAVQKQPELFL